tara:strand:- start:51 stop:191 length:141 start_codon:yes stop_codon:yes gene_type:complete
LLVVAVVELGDTMDHRFKLVEVELVMGLVLLVVVLAESSSNQIHHQ